MKKIKEQNIYIIDNNYNIVKLDYNIVKLDYNRCRYMNIVDIFKNLEFNDIKRFNNKTEFIKHLKEVL